MCKLRRCVETCIDIIDIILLNYFEVIMGISYKLISKFYGLLDKVYFKNNDNNPRFILSKKIQNNVSKLLEIAIGTAENSILLAKQNPNINIVGIDLSMEMLKIAQNRIYNENINNIELKKMDAMNIEFDDQTFDYIVISLLLHEISENNANIILSECLKVLKNNGKLYIIEWEEPNSIIQKILFSIIKFMEPFANKEFKTFMKKDLKIYFLKNGFQVKSIEHGDYSKVIELVKSATST
jgi:demethylmenaquinone methyltransferase/2-methoxy-6-polyprenyl-1,4-benzoquinol methylase